MKKLDDMIINEIWHFMNRPVIKNNNENLNNDLKNMSIEYDEYDDTTEWPEFFKEKIIEMSNKYIHQIKLGE